MKDVNRIRAREMAIIMKALGHPYRVRLMELLMDGRWSVGELAKHLDTDVSSTSKHLLILKNAGLAFVKKRGLHAYYFTHCHCIKNFHKCVQEMLTDALKKRIRMLDLT